MGWPLILLPDPQYLGLYPQSAESQLTNKLLLPLSELKLMGWPLVLSPDPQYLGLYPRSADSQLTNELLLPQ